MKINFSFVGEGTSDDGLVPLLETLCIRCGANGEVSGTALDRRRLINPSGKRVHEQVDDALQLNPDANLMFIHRDSDSSEAEQRRNEIASEMNRLCTDIEWVPVVPVQELEAWLLLDEFEIRYVAGKPRGKRQLNLPSSPEEVEEIANPKERLMNALTEASEHSGRRLKRFKKTLPRLRRLLLQRLDIDGPLSQVPAWQQLERELRQAIESIRNAALA